MANTNNLNGMAGHAWQSASTQPNTISIGAYGSGGSGIIAQTLHHTLSLDDLALNRHEYVKRYEVIEIAEDILALSVAWKRLRDNRENAPVYVTSLLSHGLFEKVTNEDRVRANEIRDYFSKKIMLWTLKDVRLSQYRQDLSDLIHGDSKKMVEKMLPIAFRLPEFYEYDVEFDKFKQDITLDIKNYSNSDSRQRVATLKPVKCFYKSNKRIKQFEYWLTDDNGNASMIAIEPKNPLKHIWDNLFTNERLRIEATYYPKKYDDLHYFQVLNWKLA